MKPNSLNANKLNVFHNYTIFICEFLIIQQIYVVYKVVYCDFYF